MSVRRYRVREIGPGKFTAERKGWVFWTRLNAEGSENDGSRAWAAFPIMWGTAEHAQRAIEAAEQARSYPKLVAERVYE